MVEAIVIVVVLLLLRGLFWKDRRYGDGGTPTPSGWEQAKKGGRR